MILGDNMFRDIHSGLTHCMIKASSCNNVYHLSICLSTFYPLILWCDISGHNTLVENMLSNKMNQHQENKADLKRKKKCQKLEYLILLHFYDTFMT